MDKRNLAPLDPFEYPGFYIDAEGGLHISVTEVLLANDVADTPENRATLEQAARDAAFDRTIPVVEVTD